MALGTMTAGPAIADSASDTGKASAGAAASSAATLTQAQAGALARKTGKPVQVTGATTPTSTLTANANGTYTLNQSTSPVRKKVGSAWVSLDATLVRGSGGTISPKATTGALTLSGGGSGALASLHYGADSLSLSLPSSIPSLPTPTLAGGTATYADVLPGVNLLVTADDQGGFSEVFEVENAKAAANPALDSLTFPTKTHGLAVHADAAGNLTASTATGTVLFSAPAATMWDSTAVSTAVAARAAANPATGAKVDARTGRPLASSIASPGEGAHTASLKARFSGNALTLTPDAATLRGAKVAYPVYIDPSWTFTAPSSAGTEQAHTYVTSVYPTTAYWNTSSLEQVGYTDWDSNYIGVSRSYYREGLSSALYGATVISSTFYVTEEWSASCSARTVDLYQTGVISSSTTWNTKPSDNTLIASANVAHGYSSSCAAASVPFTITGEMQTAASGSWSNITLGLVAADETDDYAWKQFSDTATLTTTFDKAPTVGAMSTSPKTSCSSTKTIGLGPVTLYAEVSSPEGTQNPLGVAFQLWKTSAGSGTLLASTDINTFTASSGTTASYQVSQSTLSTAAAGSVTEFSWYVRTWDGYLSSSWSSVCNFDYDPTTPGAPVVTGSATGQVGVSQTFTLAPGSCPSTSTTCTPSSYIYQLNGQQPQTINATSGKATITVKPTRRTDELTVTGETSGGNLGDPSTSVINATAAANAADKDLTGDGAPDVLTVGRTYIASTTVTDPTSTVSKTGYMATTDTSSSISAGLWRASDTGTSGSVTATATDIGTNGDGVTNDYKPGDFTGDQAITGRFYAQGYQDVLAYNPTTTVGEVITGSGDGSALPTLYAGHVSNITSGQLQDINGDNPLQLAATYNASAGVDSTSYPDLIGISGDSKTGYYLDYYQSQGTDTWNFPDEIVTDPTVSSPTALVSPDGSADWNTWVISSTQVTDTSTCTTSSPCDDMTLWQPSSGLLYLWANLSYATSNQGNGKLTYTQTNLSSSALFEQGVNLAGIEIADFAGTGTPGIWATTTDGKTTAYPVTISSSGTATLGGLTGTAATSSHAWSLADYASSTASDNTAGTALPLTGSSGATLNTGDLFKRDVEFDSASSGRLYSSTSTTSGGALTLTGSFTVSFWADPTVLGGVVVSQDGSANSGIEIWPGSSGWEYALNTGAGTAKTWDTITGGTVQLNAWSHVTATYNVTTKVMNLYVDGTFVATGNHTAPSSGATGAFQIGDNIDGGVRDAFFDGTVAQVETISGQAITPNQPSAASYHQSITPERILDTRSTTGDTLTENTTSAATAVASYSTTVLQIVGDGVTPIVSGAPTTIPASATAVAIDITVTSETANGDLITYADGTQRPVTSTTNYAASTNTTGYQIVPIGADGAIAFFNASTGTTHLIVDITGYYTTDATLTGDQTYHPLAAAYRFFDTRNSTANTSLTSTGTVAAGSTFTATIAGVDGIPSSGTDTPTAVAINITAANQTGSGIIEAYQAGTTEPTDTTLTYLGTATASLNADIPIGTATGYVGKIAINNIGTHATAVIGDVAGYYTTNTDGEVYHAVNPTRLVDTRSGIGGSTGTVAAAGTYTLSASSTALITTATTTTPTLALQLTTTTGTANGDLIACPAGATQPGTSNLNYATGQTIANLAFTTTNSTGTISIYNQGTGTIYLIVDCSGYFANS